MAVYQAPPSLVFSRQERWSGLPFPSPMKVKSESEVAQSCPTLCDPMDYAVRGILQSRILEWVAFPFSRGSSQTRNRTQVSCIAGGFFTSIATREAQEYWMVAYPFSSGSSQPRNWTRVSCIAGRLFTNWAIREAPSLLRVILVYSWREKIINAQYSFALNDFWNDGIRIPELYLYASLNRKVRSNTQKQK